MIDLFKKKKKLANKSFFAYSAKEQKSIIRKAARGANEMQQELVEKYAKVYVKS